MLMSRLTEYNNNYSKTSGSLWKYYRDESNHKLANFKSFKSKRKINRKIPDDGDTKGVETVYH